MQINPSKTTINIRTILVVCDDNGFSKTLQTKSWYTTLAKELRIEDIVLSPADSTPATNKPDIPGLFFAISITKNDTNWSTFKLCSEDKGSQAWYLAYMIRPTTTEKNHNNATQMAEQRIDLKMVT